MTAGELADQLGSVPRETPLVISNRANGFRLAEVDFLAMSRIQRAPDIFEEKGSENRVQVLLFS